MTSGFQQETAGATFTIRHRLGREVIVSQGASYRLDLEEFETRLLREDYRRANEGAITSKEIASGFTYRVGTILSQACEAATLKRLVFWGPNALLGLLEHSGTLYRLIRSRRIVQVACSASDARFATDIVKATLYATEGISFNDFHARCAGSFQIAVGRSDLGSGIGWVDYYDDRSFVEIAGLDGTPLLLGRGQQCGVFFASFDQRFPVQTPSKSPIILVDHLDRSLDGCAELLLNHYIGDDTDASQISGDLLIGYTNQDPRTRV